jgi:NitT/TauT family transport system permease protein
MVSLSQDDGLRGAPGRAELALAREPRPLHMPERLRILAIQLAVVAGAAVFLWLLSLLHALIPPPQDILLAGWSLLSSQAFYLHLGVTIREALIGLGIAAVLGILLGTVIGASRALTDFLNPIILALYSVPKIVFLPIMLMVFGAGIGPKIANAAFHAVFPILLNALVATGEVSALLRKVARSLRATRLQTFRYVLLPSMVLPVFAGLRLGIGLAFLGALLAELFESTAGIAFLITRFYNEGRIADMLAVILALILIIIAVNAGMQAVENRLSRWRRA